jgi:hypothetical protein
MNDLKEKINTIYIISKGRPQCYTAKVLKKINYPGKWFIVLGNNDETINEYKKIWGEDRIIIFDWFSQIKKTKFLDNFFDKLPSGASPVRNATRDISYSRGELRHWQFDDDYVNFGYFSFKEKKFKTIKDGKILEYFLFKITEFGYKINLPNVGFSLAHETYPEEASNFSKRIFNAHNLNNLNFVEWEGRLNDDLINAIKVYKFGQSEFSFKFLNTKPFETQKVKGGLTDIYKDYGTVLKTMYAILYEPKVTKLVIKFGRYHHETDWKLITPKILDYKYGF